MSWFNNIVKHCKNFVKDLLLSVAIFMYFSSAGVLSGYIGDKDVSLLEFGLIFVIVSSVSPIIIFYKKKAKWFLNKRMVRKELDELLQTIRSHNCNHVVARDDRYIVCSTEDFDCKIVFNKGIRFPLSKGGFFDYSDQILAEIENLYPGKFTAVTTAEFKNSLFELMTSGLFEAYRNRALIENDKQLERERKQFEKERNNVP